MVRQLKYTGISLWFSFFSISALLGQENFLAGAAKINITPEVPIRMSGYANRDEPFSGVHDSIYATALTFTDGSDKLVLIAADVVGFSHEFVDETKKQIEKLTGIEAQQILIIAAHNHGGPVTSVYTENKTEAETEYFQKLKHKLAEVTQEAWMNMNLAKIGAGTGTCRMNINRRARHADGGIWLGRNPDGLCDHEVGIIRIDDLQDNPIGVFLNWPCHATVSGQENTQITGDWPGSAARNLGKQVNAVIMVTAGASADINPIYGPNAKFNDIEAIGQLLGEEAFQIYQDILTTVPDEINVINAELMAKGKKRSASRMPNVSLENGENQQIRVVGCKIGPVVLGGISGELMTEIGMDIKKISPYKNTFIITHCNGSNGYLCTDEAYREGGYEPMVSKTMPGTADHITSTFSVLLNKL